MRDTKDINDYVFIYDFDGTSIYYPISEKKYWKKNLYEFTDQTGKRVIKELIDISKKRKMAVIYNTLGINLK